MTHPTIIESANPANGAPLEPVPVTSAEALTAAIARARRAQPAWAALTLDQRAERIRALAKRIVERHDEGARIMAAETGRGRTECLMSEVVSLTTTADMAIRAGRQALAVDKVKLPKLEYPGKSARIEPVPRGVIAIIAPWNYPLGNFVKSLLPALLAGNAVLLKPSEHTPRTGQWLADQCAAIFPEGLVAIAQGAGDVGAAVLEADIDAIVFTGSVPTGRRVAARAAERLIPCSVELGGKDAAIVLADCAPERTAAGVAYWGLHNAGQNCAAIERVYVEEAIADSFVARLKAVIQSLQVSRGDGLSDLGPLQNARQLQIVEEHVQDALAQGATLCCGGARTGHGLGYAPTLLDRCTHAMKIVQEETFGPVLAVIRVKNAEEAVRLANNSPYGLNGSVWTRDLARGEALARQLKVGVALVNNHAITGILPELPWTGTGDTGTGTACSRYAYPTFVRRQAVFIDGQSDPDPWWFPANADLQSLSERLIERSLGSIPATLKLLPLLKKRGKAILGLTRPS